MVGKLRKGQRVVFLFGPYEGLRGTVTDVLGDGNDCTDYPYRAIPVGSGDVDYTWPNLYAREELEAS